MSGIRIVGFIIRSVLMGMIAAIFLFIFFPELLKPITEPQITIEDQPPELVSYADIISKASNSVVNIRTFNIEQEVWFPNRGKLNVSGGSGVLVSDQGYIVTNYHVVAEAQELTVELKDGRTAIPQMIGYDQATDLAVLKISLENLPYIIMSSNIRSMMGDLVFAIGYPFGVGQVATMGIVSATGRQFRVAEYEDYIQTDAISNPGNSGGALINARGELLGIVSSQFSSGGISFAISTALAMDVVEQIVTHGRVIRGWMGFSGGPLDKSSREKYGEFSYLINGITPGGPADKAGLKRGDILVGINGKSEATLIDMHHLIASFKPGQKVSLDVVRNEQRQSLTVTVEERPESENRDLSTLNR